ncbi:MAG TPA: phosphoribosyltransferase family protein [Kamptonema sp.]|nr:phosphoribosyltransferase family protein [Kamptonema sp.]
MLSNPLFCDRAEAGEKLAEVVLSEIAKFNETAQEAARPIVYALPRGGLPVAVPIARRLCCPLDVVVAKKITRPDNPELAIGAVTADGHILWSPQKPRNFRVQNSALQKAQEKAQAQLIDFSPGRPKVNPTGALAILVDDGIATGMTMMVAAQALRLYSPAGVWICSPLAPLELMEFLEVEADRAIVLETPDPFFSVSRFYGEFPQVETEAAIACLQQQVEWLSEA